MSLNMRMMKSVLAATVAIVVGSVAALAQTPPAAPAAPKAPAVTAPAPTAAAPAAAAKPAAANLKKSMTPEGQACSADADAKNLHGKERKKFRAACMKGKTAGAAPAKKN
jgi:psiF repeat